MTRLRLVQMGRIFFALLIPLPLVLVRYDWHATNSIYHPESYDPASFWLASLPELLLLIAVAFVVAFWRFRSAAVGAAMSGGGLAILALFATLILFAL
ncbi:MAG: hypothetical protein U0S50_01440 [Sphingopyxis sp.]|uniref:hypothetical protein n=1 Tax=Sphingopyxis sp. TaxID=1908224 RepID=UPI002ABBB6B1|nr:hypothetical protein [Sphingopyxis sp.]MDZ3830464.1 hypothetical protein [Sphingopyxis sp.]